MGDASPKEMIAMVVTIAHAMDRVGVWESVVSEMNLIRAGKSKFTAETNAA